jgi:outer membrane protein OmpA-like peptidoglycan-associated protein
MAEPEKKKSRTPRATTTEPPQRAAPDQSDSFTQLIREAAALLLPLVISGAGLAALVVGVGGAVSMARFYSAGLPANQAVNAATESDMQAIGITWLITFGLVGLLAVLLAYIASPNGKATAAMHYALIGIVAVELTVVWQLARGDSGQDFGWRDAAAAVALLAATVTAVWVVVRRHIHAVSGDDEPPNLLPYLKKGFKVVVTVFWRVVLATALMRRVWRRKRPGSVTPEGGHGSLGKPAMGGTEKRNDDALVLTLWDYVWLGLLTVGAAVLAGWLLRHWWVVFSVVTAGALGLLTIRVAALNATPPRFRWYGVCVFFSVGLFGAALGVFRMADEPRLQPVAFLRTEGDEVTAMQGIYVGESDERLWFASVALDECGASDVRRGSGRLLWVPSNEVSHLTIGPPMGLPKLAHEATAMRDDVMAEHHGKEARGTPEAVRDSVAVDRLGIEGKVSGWWLEIGRSKDLGEHPRVMLGRRSLRLRHPLDGDNHTEDAGLWQVRLPRRARSGAVYANCGERTNRAWLTVPRRPFAMPTATDQGDGTLELTARGSLDPDGHLMSYTWMVDGTEYGGRVVEVSAPQAGRYATLIVEDDSRVRDTENGRQSLTDDRKVRLDATVARTFPSDLLFCFDCRRLRKAGARRVRALRHDAVGAYQVVVRAHTDERGSRRHNKRLANYRAHAVAKALFGGMLKPPEDKKIRGVGERDVADPGDHRENRRVEVVIYREPPS